MLITEENLHPQLKRSVVKGILNHPKNFMKFSEYEWPGKFAPFRHQKQTVKFLVTNKRAIVLNDIGTGKTMSALWAADFLITSERISKVLILSPLSTLERVWADEIKRNFPDRSAVVLHGTAKQRLALLKEPHEIFIINHDGMNIIADEAFDMFDLIIIDESSVYKNNSSQRFKKLYAWIKKHKDKLGVWLMTGTPTPNAPADAWTQARLIQNPDAPNAFTAFRRDVMNQVSQYRWAPKPEWKETVHKILQPSIRFVRDECVDLPPTVTLERQCQLSRNQLIHFNQMAKEFMTEIGGQEVIARNGATKIAKLIQICCGLAYSADGKIIEIGAKNRLALLDECLEQTGGKALIFAPLPAAIDMIERHVGGNRNVGIIDGRTNPEKRARIFDGFQNGDSVDTIIAHPATMSHGLTLTAAKSIIWYAPIYSNEQYTQANGRVERIGKKHSSTVFHIYAHPIERRIYKALAGKQKMQGILLDMLANDR